MSTCLRICSPHSHAVHQRVKSLLFGIVNCWCRSLFSLIQVIVCFNFFPTVPKDWSFSLMFQIETGRQRVETRIGAVLFAIEERAPSAGPHRHSFAGQSRLRIKTKVRAASFTKQVLWLWWLKSLRFAEAPLLLRCRTVQGTVPDFYMGISLWHKINDNIL